MGFEHLLAALLMNAEEKRRNRRRMEEEAAARREEHAQERAIETYLAGKGYDRKRQRYLTGLAKSSLREDRREFMLLLGRPYCKEDFTIKWAVRAIAEREGWTFFDENDLYFDEEYYRLRGWLPLDADVIAICRERLEEQRRKEKIWQEWAHRNPKCMEVDVSPEFYDSEESFSLVVEEEYRKKQWK